MKPARLITPGALALKGWVAVVAALTYGGWLLSSRGWLRPPGILAWLLLAALIGWMAASGTVRLAPGSWHRLVRRFTRPLPLAYGVLALVILLGAVGHEATNYDALWYRLPRVHHWLAEGRWHWIHSTNLRLNCVAIGYEWAQLPWMLLPGGEHWTFLPSWISFLMLPGATFAAFRQLGVPRRSASRWMWLVPAGWMYALQAGGSANDAWAAVFSLCGIAWARESVRTRRFGALAWSVIAMALLTNTKQLNLVLLLPWLLAVRPALGLVLRHPALALGVAVVAAVVSALPITIANLQHTGSWIGWRPEERNFVPANPAFALLVNPVILAFQNLSPPFIPATVRWNVWVRDLAAGPLASLTQGFEFFARQAGSIGENTAGVGPLLVVTLALVCQPRPTGRRPGPPAWLGPSLLFIGVLLCARLGTRELARYFAAVVPLGIAWALARRGAESVYATSRWRVMATLTFAGAFFVVWSGRNRPLWPLPQVVHFLAQRTAPEGAFGRLDQLYSFHTRQAHQLDSMAGAIPDSVSRAGFASEFPGELALWHRGLRVRHIRPGETRADIDRAGLRYAILSTAYARRTGAADGADWAARHGARLVQSLAVPIGGPRADIDLHHLVEFLPQASP